MKTDAATPIAKALRETGAQLSLDVPVLLMQKHGLGASASIEQTSFPKDRREVMVKTASTLIELGLKTPEELAARLDMLAPNGALRQYSRAFWRLMSSFDSSLVENPDWQAIYAEKDKSDTIRIGKYQFCESDSVSEPDDEDNGSEIDELREKRDSLPRPNPATFGLTFEVIAMLKTAILRHQQPHEDEPSNTKTKLYKALFACSVIGGGVYGFVDGLTTKTQLSGLIGGLILGPLVVAIVIYGVLYVGACVACLLSALCFPFVSIYRHFWPPLILESEIPESYKNYLGKLPPGISLDLFRKLSAFEKAETEWIEAQNRLKRSHWLALDGWSFEHAVAEVLRKKGYEVQVTSGSNDGGIDLIIMREGRCVIAQCKNHALPVGPAVVREIYGAMISHGASEAWLISSSGITDGATNFTEGKPIRVVDLNEIIRWEAAVQKAA